MSSRKGSRDCDLTLKVQYLNDDGTYTPSMNSRLAVDRNGQVCFEDVYREVQKFHDRHPELNSQVVIRHRGMHLQILRASGFKAQEIDGEEVISVELIPVESISKYNQRCDKVEEILQKVNELESLGMGVLYGDPLKVRSGQIQYTAKKSVSYEHEIRRIIARVMVQQTVTQKFMKVVSKPATRANLMALLEDLNIKLLHINCHGSEDGKLQWEGENSIGMEEELTVEQFRSILQSSLGNKRKLSCIVVMACHSQPFVEVAKNFADFAVGVGQDSEIHNRASEIFSEKFYAYLIGGYSYKQSAIQAKQEIDKAFRYCDCNPYHQDEDKPYSMCYNEHPKRPCNCRPNPNYVNWHTRDSCIGKLKKTFVELKKITNGTQWYICCCGYDHNESNKIYWPEEGPKQNSGLGIVKERRCCLGTDEDESQFIPMPDEWLPRKRKIDDLIRKIQQPLGRAGTLLVAGEYRSGKSCLIKKLATYLLYRGKSSKILEWAYLDMKNFRSILQVMMSSRIKRNGRTYHGLEEILAYLKDKGSLLVFDHCDSIAYNSRFPRLLELCIGALTKQSRVIIIMRTQANGNREFSKLNQALQELNKKLSDLQNKSLKTFITDNSTADKNQVEDQNWLDRIKHIEDKTPPFREREEHKWKFEQGALDHPNDTQWKSKFNSLKEDYRSTREIGWDVAVGRLRDEYINSKLQSLKGNYSVARRNRLRHRYEKANIDKYCDKYIIKAHTDESNPDVDHLIKLLGIDKAYLFLREDHDTVKDLPAQDSENTVVEGRLDEQLLAAMTILVEPYTEATISFIARLLGIEHYDVAGSKKFEMVDKEAKRWSLKRDYKLPRDSMRNSKEVFEVIKLLQLLSLRNEINRANNLERPFETWPLSNQVNQVLNWDSSMHKQRESIEKFINSNEQARESFVREQFNFTSSYKYRRECLGEEADRLSIFKQPRQERLFTLALVSHYSKSQVGLAMCSEDLHKLIGDIESYNYFGNEHQRLFDIHQAAYQLLALRHEERAPIQLELNILIKQLMCGVLRSSHSSYSEEFVFQLQYSEWSLKLLVDHLGDKHTAEEWDSYFETINQTFAAFSKLKPTKRQRLRHYTSLSCSLAEWLEGSPTNQQHISTIRKMREEMRAYKQSLGAHDPVRDGFRQKFWFFLNCYKCRMQLSVLTKSPLSEYLEIRSKFNEHMMKSCFHQSVVEFYSQLQDRIRKMQGSLIKILSAEHFLRGSRGEEKQYRSWTEECIERVISQSRRINKRLSAAAIELDTLTQESYNKAHQEECLVLFINADWCDGRMTMVDNMLGKTSVNWRLDWKCKILVLCGRSIPKFERKHLAANFIILGVKSSPQTSPQDGREFLINQLTRLYLEDLMYEFIKGLLSRSDTTTSTYSPKRAFILAQHIANCTISQLFFEAGLSDELQQYTDRLSNSGICLDSLLEIQYELTDDNIELELGCGPIVGPVLQERLDFFTKVQSFEELQHKLQIDPNTEYFICIGNQETMDERVLSNLLYSMRECAANVKPSYDRIMPDLRIGDCTSGFLCVCDQDRLFSAVVAGCQVFLLAFDFKKAETNLSRRVQCNTIQQAQKAITNLLEKRPFYSQIEPIQRMHQYAPRTTPTPPETFKAPKGPGSW